MVWLFLLIFLHEWFFLCSILWGDRFYDLVGFLWPRILFFWKMIFFYMREFSYLFHHTFCRCMRSFWERVWWLFSPWFLFANLVGFLYCFWYLLIQKKLFFRLSWLFFCVFFLANHWKNGFLYLPSSCFLYLFVIFLCYQNYQGRVLQRYLLLIYQLVLV